MTQGFTFPSIDRKFWRRLWELLSPYFLSEEKFWAWTLVIVSNVLLLVNSSLGPLIPLQLGEMISALAKSDQPRFYHAVYTFAVLSITSAISIGFGYYSLFLLVVRWRRWLTKKIIAEYLDNRAYYRISNQAEIDNPDLRIAEEVESLLFGVLTLGSLLPVFSGRSVFAITTLWVFSPPLTVTLIVVGLLNTWISYRFFFTALLGIQYAQQQREGNFRTGLVKIRENAESIAFYRGEEREKSHLGNLFQEVFINQNKLLRWRDIYFYGFNGITNTLVGFLGYIFVAPRILSGQIEIGGLYPVLSNSAILYVVFSIFGQLVGGLSSVLNSVVRVNQLIKAIEGTDEEILEPGITTEEADRITISNLTLKTPNQERTLFEHLNITVNPGESLLIMGKSGVGKSSLLRAIAGLWLSGTGLILRPNLNDIFFLPQSPYMGLGTLRQQLLYPTPTRDNISQAELEKALDAVNLKDLPNRVGGFDIELDWAKVLSPGEQQRLSFARVILSAPQYIILDEATSALDTENEQHLYKAIAGKQTTIISVGHRSELVTLHDHLLKLP